MRPVFLQLHYMFLEQEVLENPKLASQIPTCYHAYGARYAYLKLHKFKTLERVAVELVELTSLLLRYCASHSFP